MLTLYGGEVKKQIFNITSFPLKVLDYQLVRKINV